MKSLNLDELAAWIRHYNKIILGAQVQSIWTNERLLVLEMYRERNYFLVFDLSPNMPNVFIIEDEFNIKSKKTKPIGLFLNSHLKNKRLGNIELDFAKGRVVMFSFGRGLEEITLEAQLIPRALNIIVKTNDKKISLNKPRELPPNEIVLSENLPELDFEERNRVWVSSLFEKAKGHEVDYEKERLKLIEKKQKAISEVERSIKEEQSVAWSEIGERIKSGESLESLDRDHPGKIEVSKGFRWNLENAFAKSKDQKRKIEGAQERLNLLYLELEKIKSGELPTGAKHNSSKPQKGAKSILQAAGARGRRIVLESGLEAVFGKSAADNLAILRKAQAWDYWLHLRDFPGAHAIIRRNRNQSVSMQDIKKVSEWLIRESVNEIQPGQKYDVVLVECRYVKPIKGDRLGRVIYHNEQVLTFSSSH